MITYTQWIGGLVGGFNPNTNVVDTNCTLNVATTNFNRVTAFTNQAQTQDRAYATLSGGPSMFADSTYRKGRFRFRLTGVTNYPLTNFFRVISSGGAGGVPDFTMQTDGRVNCFMPRMGAGGGFNNLTVSDILGGVVVLNTTYLVEFVYAASLTSTSFYEVKVDGNTVATGTPPSAGDLQQPGEITVGWNDASNSEGTNLGATIEVWDTVIANTNETLPAEGTVPLVQTVFPRQFRAVAGKHN
jgi:hypothetical protein